MTSSNENHNIKINDIFCSTGHSGHNIKFFQVVALRGKSQVIIREIVWEKIGENEIREDIVMPKLNHFKEQSECMYVEDNSIGMAKTLKKDREGKIYISFNWFLNEGINGKIKKVSYYDEAYLWDSLPKIDYVVYY